MGELIEESIMFAAALFVLWLAFVFIAARIENLEVRHFVGFLVIVAALIGGIIAFGPSYP